MQLMLLGFLSEHWSIFDSLSEGNFGCSHNPTDCALGESLPCPASSGEQISTEGYKQAGYLFFQERFQGSIHAQGSVVIDKALRPEPVHEVAHA